jgi:hypothetical protein
MRRKSGLLASKKAFAKQGVMAGLVWIKERSEMQVVASSLSAFLAVSGHAWGIGRMV